MYLLRERRTSIAWRATLFVELASAPKNKFLFADVCVQYIAYQACLHIYCETKLKQISFSVHDHILLQITLAKKHFVLSRQKIKFCVK